MSLLSTLTSGGAIPTPTACFGNIAPDIRNLTGLSGRVCQVNIQPDLVNIQGCCNDGAQARVQDNCTQYCETDQSNFLSCVSRELVNTTISQPNALCREINGTTSASSTISGISGSPTQSTPATVSTAAAAHTYAGGLGVSGLPGQYSFAIATMAVTMGFGFLVFL